MSKAPEPEQADGQENRAILELAQHRAILRRRRHRLPFARNWRGQPAGILDPAAERDVVILKQPLNL